MRQNEKYFGLNRSAGLCHRRSCRDPGIAISDEPDQWCGTLDIDRRPLATQTQSFFTRAQGFLQPGYFFVRKIGK